MHNETFYPNCDEISKTPGQLLGNFLYQGLVLSIAFPLACLVMLVRGLRLILGFVTDLSFKCCVWICLGAIMLLFLLAVTVQLAVASVG